MSTEASRFHQRIIQLEFDKAQSKEHLNVEKRISTARAKKVAKLSAALGDKFVEEIIG